MSPVEIEAAISELADQPFDPAEFPFAFLAAFGNKDTALKAKAKAKFILATEGQALAGISTIKDIPIDVRAAGRLEKLFERYTQMTAGPGEPGLPCQQRRPSARAQAS